LNNELEITLKRKSKALHEKLGGRTSPAVLAGGLHAVTVHFFSRDFLKGVK